MNIPILSIEDIFKEIIDTESNECKTTLYDFYMNEYIERKEIIEELDKKCIDFMEKRDEIAEKIYSLVPKDLINKSEYQSISEYIRGIISDIEEIKLVDQELINQLRYYEGKVIEYNNLSEKEVEKIKRLSYNPFIIILSQLNGDIEKFLDIIRYLISKFFLDTFTNDVTYDNLVEPSKEIIVRPIQRTDPFIEHVVSKINEKLFEKIFMYLDKRSYDHNWGRALSSIEELLIGNINDYMVKSFSYGKYESIIKKEINRINVYINSRNKF